MTKVLSARVDDATARVVDQVASDHGMNRSDWLAAVIDRALVGAGRMAPETAAERRQSRSGARPVRPGPGPR